MALNRTGTSVWRRRKKDLYARTRTLETALERSRVRYSGHFAEAVKALASFAPDETAAGRLRELLDDENVEHYAAEVLLVHLGQVGLGHVLDALLAHGDNPETSLLVGQLTGPPSGWP